MLVGILVGVTLRWNGALDILLGCIDNDPIPVTDDVTIGFSSTDTTITLAIQTGDRDLLYSAFRGIEV